MDVTIKRLYVDYKWKYTRNMYVIVEKKASILIKIYK